MALTLAGLLAVYLLGAIPIGYLLARWFGRVDIRQQGSGNIGATNVLRTLGKGPAAMTFLGDVGKGWLAVWVAEAVGPEAWWGALGALLAIVGNCWSVFLRFKGGKGVATGFGALLRLAPLATLPALLVWAAVIFAFRYVSLASVAAAVCVPVGVLLLGYPAPAALAAAAVAALVVFRHRDNLVRLLQGTERKLQTRAPAA
jgi:glycerol-3-phosphate acyltransferase PlsY